MDPQSKQNTPTTPQHEFRFGQGIRQYAQPTDGERRGGAESSPSATQGTEQSLSLGSFGPVTQGYRSADVEQLAQMRSALSARRDELLAKFSSVLDEQEQKLLSRAATANDLLRGSKSNLQNDQKELSKIADSWNPFLHAAASVFSDTRETMEKQVRASEKMVQDHTQRVSNIDDAVGQEKERAEKKKEVLREIEAVFRAEEEKLRLVEELRRAEQQNDTQRVAAVHDKLSSLNIEGISARAEKKLGDIMARFSAGDPQELFAKHRQALRGMNHEFGKCIESLNTTEAWSRVGLEVAVMAVAAGATVATGGAAGGILASLLYGVGVGAGVGMAMKGGLSAIEIGGHAAYGNYSNEKLKELSVNAAKDTAWSGLECGLAGLGMGWAGHAARVQPVVVKAVSSGRYASGLWGFNGAAYRNSFALWRRTAAIRNAWRMTTPSTMFHTAKDLCTGKLTPDASSISISLGGNYAIASLCAGNAQISHTARQRLTEVGVRQFLSSDVKRRIFLGSPGAGSIAGRMKALSVAGRWGAAKTGQAALFGLEGVTDYLAVSRSMGLIDKWLDRESTPEERQRQLQAAVLGHIIGGFTSQSMNQQGKQAQQRADTLSSGLSEQAQRRHAATGHRGSVAPVEVEVNPTSKAAAFNTTKEGTRVVQVSTLPESGNRQALAAQAQVERAVLRDIDDGFVRATIDPIKDRTHIATRAIVGSDREPAQGFRRFAPRELLHSLNEKRRIFTNGLRGGEQHSVREVLHGHKQTFGKVDATLAKVLDDSFTDQERTRLSSRMVEPGLTVNQRLAIVEDAVSAKGLQLTKGDLKAINKVLKNNTPGELDDAVLRGADVDPTANPVLLGKQVEAVLTKIVAEAQDFNSAYKRGHRTTGDNKNPLDSTPHFEGRLGMDALRNRWGATWGRIKDTGWGVGSTARFSEKSLNFVKGVVGIEANSILGIVHTGPLGIPTSAMYFDIPLAGAAGIRSVSTSVLRIGKKGSDKLGLTSSASPASPPDAARAVGFEEQLSGWLGKQRELSARGVEVDPQLARAAEHTLRDTRNTFANANSRRGLGPLHTQVFPKNSAELKGIRQAFRDALEAGWRYSPESQLTAFRNQGLRLIDRGTAKSMKDFEQLVAFGADRFNDATMREMTSRFRERINASAQSSQPTHANTKGYMMRTRDQRAEQRQARTQEGSSVFDSTPPVSGKKAVSGKKDSTRNEEITSGYRKVLGNYEREVQSAGQRGWEHRERFLARNPELSGALVYQRELLEQNRAIIDGPNGWLSGNRAAGRDPYEALAQMSEIAVERSSRRSYKATLKELDESLKTASDEAQRKGQTARVEELHSLREAVGSRSRLSGELDRLVGSFDDLATLRANIEVYLSRVQREVGGQQYFSEQQKAAELARLNRQAEYQAKQTRTSDPEAAELHGRKAELLDNMANERLALANQAGERNLGAYVPVLEHFSMPGREGLVPGDVRSTPVISRGWDANTGLEGVAFAEPKMRLVDLQGKPGARGWIDSLLKFPSSKNTERAMNSQFVGE